MLVPGVAASEIGFAAYSSGVDFVMGIGSSCTTAALSTAFSFQQQQMTSPGGDGFVFTLNPVPYGSGQSGGEHRK